MVNTVVPKTKFEWIDQSSYNTTEQTTVLKNPMYLAAFAAPKGSEDLMVVNANNFTKQYGSCLSFPKYGQAFSQAARVVNAGGQILAKRVVAKDSYLANLAVLAVVTSKEVQKTDNNGNPLYKDTVTGDETIVSTDNEAIMITKCSVKYTTKSFEHQNSMVNLANMLENEYKDTEDTHVYPLFVIGDNGRGESSKKFRISPNYASAKNVGHCVYVLEIIEGTEVLETLAFSGDPNYISGNVNQWIDTLVNTYSYQVKCNVCEKGVESFIDKVAEISGLTTDTLYTNDYLFAKTLKQAPLDNIIIDTDSEDAKNLSYSFGLQLENGDNGSFGKYPVSTDEYETALLEFFDGSFTDDIYDLDNYKLDIICDANYPAKVKRAIEALVAFREDLYYFRDLGLGLTTINDILEADAPSAKNRFCASYHLSYQELDEYSRKPVEVTCTYDLAELLVNHFRDGKSRPFCGQLYGITLDRCIHGTESFLPKVTPKYDQKQVLADARINYASYYDGLLVVETEYTSQEMDSDLSFINSVIAMQEIVKTVRTRCPKTRYSLIDGEQLGKYQNDVNDVLSDYSSNFNTLKMVYLEDKTMLNEKIYYAAILCENKDFIQQEYFKLYALDEVAS